MILSFVACGQNDTDTQTQTPTQTQVQTPTQTQTQTPTQAQTQTNTDEAGFSEQTKQAVTDFVAMYGKDSKNYNGDAYVVCDFDNTTAVFDITYQTIVY